MIKKIEGFPNYCVWSDGTMSEVYNCKTGAKLQPTPQSKGYLRFTLMANGKRFDKYLHRVVAEAFVPNPKPFSYTTVDHEDNNKLNNGHSNLRWVSNSDNVYKRHYGTLPKVEDPF